MYHLRAALGQQQVGSADDCCGGARLDSSVAHLCAVAAQALTLFHISFQVHQTGPYWCWLSIAAQLQATGGWAPVS